MKLSIIIPAYNAEKYIEECLQSIGDLKDSRLEVIVINDGSLDNTKSILEKYEDIICFNNQNKGVSFSRNFGISKATGDYIMFLDADDCLKENWSEILNYKTDKDIIYINSNLNKKCPKEELLRHIVGMKYPCIAGPVSKLYKTEFLRNNMLFFKEDLINGEDMLFNIDCLNKIKDYSVINKSIYLYRQNITSATKNFNDRIFFSDKRFHEYLEQILKEITLYSKTKKEITLFCKINAIITILDRMAYLATYKEFRKNIKYTDDVYLQSLHKKNSFISKKSRFILFLFKIKQYRIVYILLRYKHKRSRIDNEYFIDL